MATTVRSRAAKPVKTPAPKKPLAAVLPQAKILRLLAELSMAVRQAREDYIAYEFTTEMGVADGLQFFHTTLPGLQFFVEQALATVEATSSGEVIDLSRISTVLLMIRDPKNRPGRYTTTEATS